MELFNLVNAVLIPGAGLESVRTALVDSWLGPLALIIIAVVAIILLWQRKIMAFASFALVATLATMLIFMGGDFFGENKGLTATGKDLTNKISN